MAASSAAAAPRQRRLPAPVIVFEDADLIIMDKPAGLACHAGTGHAHDTLAARLVAYLGAAAAPPGARPGLAQRLDRGVSGLVPAGKHATALRGLAVAVVAGTACKTYLALVRGRVVRTAATIDLPLRVDDQPHGARPRTFVDALHGKPAVTTYRRLAVGRAASLLAVRIATGRTHQIRAHLAAIGHPLLADPRYGDAADAAHLAATFGARDPLLHAARLALPHPTQGGRIVVRARPPTLWLRVAHAQVAPAAVLRTLAEDMAPRAGPLAPSE